MITRLRFLLLLVAGLVVCGGLLLANPSAPAYAQSCDTSGTVDGVADPGFVQANTVVTFTATGFTAGEDVSFWFTTPQGDVVGTAQPLCCAGNDGRVVFAPTTLPPVFFQFPGKWALTVQGASSSHQSIIFFCLGVAQQPTAVPATNTPVPPAATATTAPVEPTATTAAATSVPTAEASATSAPIAPTVEASPTTGAATAVVATSVPVATAPAATATVEVMPTMAAPTAEPSPVVIGMPITGNGGSDGLLLMGVVLAAICLLALGLVARKASVGNR